MKNNYKTNRHRMQLLSVFLRRIGLSIFCSLVFFTTYATQLSGTYSIDSAGTASATVFTNFSSAITYLTSANTRSDGGPSNSSPFGVSGPVVFNVRKGTYIEQTMFLTVPGSSAVNSITFQSEANHADSVNLQFNSLSAASNWVLNLNGASFFKVRNMTISPLNVTYGIALAFGNSASSDSFYNVVFKGIASTLNTLNRVLVSQPSQTNISNYISFDTCRFINGACGTNIQSSNSSVAGLSSQCLSINNCDFTNQYACGMFNYYLNGVRLTKNRISTNSTLTTFYGMYNYWIMELAPINRCIITGNTITGSAGGYGMYNYNIGVNSNVTSNRGLIANNVISIGTGANATVGICDNNGNGLDYVYNSVNIGTSASGNTSAAFNALTNSNGATTLTNNVFSASNGAAAISITTMSFYTTVDYNNLYTTGTNIGYIGTTPYTTLAAWRTASAKDANSISYRPGFTSNTNLVPNPGDTASWSLNGRGIHTALITTDIIGNTRPLVVANGVPDIGAYEFTPTSTAPMCTSNKIAALAGDTQYFFFSLDTVASIIWDPSFPTPSVIGVRQYSGVPPNHIAPAPNYMYFYTDLTGTSGFYSYTLGLYCRNTWMGTMLSASRLRMAYYSTATSPNWTDPTIGVTLDTVRNIIKYTYTGNLLLFTGSDVINALPIILFDVSANKIKNDAVVNWSTASEKNSNMFVMERSFDGNQFATEGEVKAAGNSNILVPYSFNDKNAVSLTSGNVIYYRLKMIDMDGKFEYSKTVTVKLNNELNDVTVVMYPNPVSNNLYIKVNLPLSGNVKIELMDITGKTLMSKTQWMEAGSNISNENLGNLSSGVYFLSTEINRERQVQKLVKE